MIAHLVHVANKVLGPVLAVAIATRLKGVTFAGWDLAVPVGVVLGGLGMVVVEVLLVKAPKRLARMRRWLDDRAGFEGLWLQLRDRGQDDNRFAVFTVSYHADTDTYAVEGTAYSSEPRRLAEWHSTHVYFSKPGAEMSYLWEGESLGGGDDPAGDRRGFARLELTPTPGLRLPASGRGVADHLLQDRRLTFEIQRVTPSFLEDLGVRERPANLYDRSKRKILVEALAARLRQQDSLRAAGPTVDVPTPPALSSG